MNKILLAEDDPNLGQLLQEYLTIKGFEATLAKDGDDARSKFVLTDYDLCIFDVMMPKKDGFTLAREVRKINREIPILFLTAKSMTEDKIEGFNAGGDDYLTKPFSVEELQLRVRALLKRVKVNVIQPEEKIVKLGIFLFDTENFTLTSPTTKQTLTKKEAMLLKLLIENKHTIITRERILQSVWGYNVFPNTRTIDNFILNFRKYFELDPKSPLHFISIRGVGYKFQD